MLALINQMDGSAVDEIRFNQLQLVDIGDEKALAIFLGQPVRAVYDKQQLLSLVVIGNLRFRDLDQCIKAVGKFREGVLDDLP